MGSRENIVTTSCIKVLDLRRIPNMRNNTRVVDMPGVGGRRRPVFFGKPGWPDIIAVLPDGRFCGIETKAPPLPGLYKKRKAGKLSDLQIAVHAQLSATGALMMCVTSSEEMDDHLRKEGYLR